jgi:hypothetical protein
MYGPHSQCSSSPATALGDFAPRKADRLSGDLAGSATKLEEAGAVLSTHRWSRPVYHVWACLPLPWPAGCLSWLVRTIESIPSDPPVPVDVYGVRSCKYGRALRGESAHLSMLCVPDWVFALTSTPKVHIFFAPLHRTQGSSPDLTHFILSRLQ